MRVLERILAIGLVVSCFYVGTVNAASFSFSGNIANHNDVVKIGFSLTSDASNVKVWTDSFMSATNFDPITAVWRKNGSDFSLIGQNDDNAGIAPGQTWYDSGIVFGSLLAGDYLFTIATYNNFAKGTLLSQGFQFDSQTPIPLSAWNQPASHANMGTYYDVHLSGVDTAQNNTVPEPSTVILLGAGLAGLVLARRKSKQS